jgi:enoyl-CoA hydratase/carnithine racemase
MFKGVTKSFSVLNKTLNPYVKHTSLNQPKSLNALDLPMIAQLHESLSNMDPTTKVWLLSGEGKAFCAGGDIKSIYNERNGKDFFD